MGLGSNDDDDLVVDDGDGDVGDCDGRGKSFGTVSCSICLELVTDNGDRSWAKLQCGHQFHLGKSKFELFLKNYYVEFLFVLQLNS